MTRINKAEVPFKILDRVALVRPCGSFPMGTAGTIIGLTNIGLEAAANIEIGDEAMRIPLGELMHAE